MICNQFAVTTRINRKNVTRHERLLLEMEVVLFRKLLIELVQPRYPVKPSKGDRASCPRYNIFQHLF